jgi:hypothetical protein
MQPISRRNFAEKDRADLQEVIIERVEQNSEQFLSQYRQSPASFYGRYVGADLFKEMFAEYRASRATRARYNAVVHNAAAVLAAEQLRRVVVDPLRPGNEVIFMTGIPGAGKTSSINEFGGLPVTCKAVFEGQLAKPKTVPPKIQHVLNAGLKPIIIAVHIRPEQALQNTFKRFEQNGRGASIALMADIQGNLPNGLAEIKKCFGEAIKLGIYDYSDSKNYQYHFGWENISILQKEGNYEQIKQRLIVALEQHRASGSIPEECYQQAWGRIP